MPSKPGAIRMPFSFQPFPYLWSSFPEPASVPSLQLTPLTRCRPCPRRRRHFLRCQPDYLPTECQPTVMKRIKTHPPSWLPTPTPLHRHYRQRWARSAAFESEGFLTGVEPLAPHRPELIETIISSMYRCNASMAEKRDTLLVSAHPNGVRD